MPNEAPLFLPTNLQIMTNVGAPTSFTAMARDHDSLFITFSAGAPLHGTLTGGGIGSFTYTPHFGFVGTDMVQVTVSDTQGGSSTQTYLIDVGGPVSLLNSSIDGAGDIVTLYFDRTLDSTHIPAAGQFGISATGLQTSPTVTSVEVVGNRVTLHLSAVLPDTTDVSFSYNAVPGSLVDRAGNDIATIAVTPIANDLSLVRSSGIEFGQSSGIKLDGAEISAFDPASDRVFATGADALQVIQVGSDLSMTLLGTIPVGVGITSVAASHGIVAVAVVGPDKTLPGRVYFIDADAPVGPGAILGSVKVGANPDMVVFTPDGSKVLIANEGELTEDGTDPVGSVSIIDISNGIAGATAQTAGFEAFNGQRDALKADGVRLFAGAAGFETTTVAQDLEPEYIAISDDGTTAFVTLQENNAIGILDIASGTFTDVVPLGLKSFKGLLADFSDRDGGINLTTGNPVYGQFMPDGIGSFTGSDGEVYFVIANEGDDRDDFLPGFLDGFEESTRVKDLTLDPTAFPNAATLQQDGALGRLGVSQAPGNDGDTNGDGDIDQLLAYGARSFSILDSHGNIVFDSGSHIEQFVALGGLYNSSTNAGLFDDSRSDNKGPEPEGVTVGVFVDSVLAFIALERGGGGVMVYDVTDPGDVTFVQYVRNLNDISPEGLDYVSAADSPNGRPFLLVSNEVSGTVTAYEIKEPDSFTLQILNFADPESGLLALTTAPNLAALVDRFEDEYVNTITIADGDNYLPGPILTASTDSSINAVVPGASGNPGVADMAILNAIGVQAAAVGNHEFDLGTNVFSTALATAKFPYLSANLDFSAESALASKYVETVGVNGLEEASSLAGKIAPSTVVTVNGEKIGIVGVTGQTLESLSSVGNVEVKGYPTAGQPGDGQEQYDIPLLAQQLQPVIDDLIAQGVNKIILNSDTNVFTNDMQLAGLLSGVDVFLTGGSHLRGGDANDLPAVFDGHSAQFEEGFPVIVTAADGKPVLLTTVDDEYTYLGRLVVTFDSEGVIDVNALDSEINGSYASTAENVAAAWGVDEADLGSTAFADGTRGGEVKAITDAIQAVIDAKEGNVFGFTDVYLEGERGQVRNQETNLGDVSADANANAAREALGLADDVAIVSIKNGGGIRAAIGSVDGETGAKMPPEGVPSAGKPDGGVSQLDLENALRFDNKLMVFDTTPEGLLNILNGPNALQPNNGGYIQIGGVQFSYDPAKPAGSRVQDIVLVDADGNKVAAIVDDGEIVAGAPSTITAVVLNFTANGGDLYPIKANGENFRFLLSDGTLSGPIDEALDFTTSSVVPVNALGEQQAFSSYFMDRFSTPGTAFDIADTPQSQDERIQNLAFREDTVLDGVTLQPIAVATGPEMSLSETMAFA